MTIQGVIDYLNKARGYRLSGAYYKHIDEWADWWRGFHKPFHTFEAREGSKLAQRELYTLKMAKKVCEDWASILLNEKTRIVVDDKASNVFLQGDSVEETGGVFGENEFWQQANELMEKAFYSGTGAAVLRMDGMRAVGDAVVPDNGTRIRLEFLPAHCILPITVRHRRIVDVAFVSEVTERGEEYVYIETHALGARGYEIKNEYFRDDAGSLQPAALPEGIAPQISTGTDMPLFAIFRPNIVPTIPKSSGLGESVFGEAIDVLKGVDLAYNNFNRDIKLGGKKVFMARSLTRSDDNGNIITPDDVMQQLFLQIGDEVLDKDNKQLISEHNPDLRIEDNEKAVQAQLDYLSFKCGLGAKYYQFNAGTVVTATQYTGDKQDLVRNASKHAIIIEQGLLCLVRAILWAGKNFCGAKVNPDAKVSIEFDDGYIIDKEAERLRDMSEVTAGLMMPWEYRVKHRGESEEDAKKILEDGAPETDDENMGFGGDS